MKKTFIILTYLIIFTSVQAMAYESSESFSLYTNNKPATDESAEEVAPENAPIDGGALILLAFAGLYALNIYRKKTKESA